MKYLTRRYAFGLKGETPPPLASRSEGAWMIAHAVCAFPYRLLVVIGIVLFVAKTYFILGFLIGVFGAIMWLIVPIFKGLSFVISDPSIQVVRQRAVGVTFGSIAAIFIFLGFVPMPNHVWGTGVIEPAEMVTYRAASNGYLQDVDIEDGQAVTKGTKLFHLFNPIMEGDYRKSLARVQTETIRLNAATAGAPVDRRLAEPLYDSAIEQYDTVSKIMKKMTVKADFTGEVIAPDLSSKIGSFIKKGSMVCTLATLDDLLIRVYVPDSSFALLAGDDKEDLPEQYSDSQIETALLSAVNQSTEQIEAKIYGLSGQTFTLQTERITPAGVRSIRHPSLGHTVKGGRIAIDQSDSNRMSTINPQWEMTLRFKDEQTPQTGTKLQDTPTQYNNNSNTGSGEIALPGTRVKVRFTLESRPLAVQWWRTIRQAFMSRFGM